MRKANSRVRLMRVGLAAAAVAAIIPASPAGAQASFVPTIIGVTVGNAVAAQQEQACQAGAQIPPPRWAKAAEAIDQDVAGYFEAAGRSDQRALRKIFVGENDNATWRDGTVEAAYGAWKDPFAERAAAVNAKPVRSALVIAGDGMTARGVWSIEIPGAADTGPTEKAEYGIDFRKGVFGNRWRIWHVSVFPAPAGAGEVKTYCHFDPKKSF